MLLDMIKEFEAYPGGEWSLGNRNGKYVAMSGAGATLVSHIGVTPTEAFEGMMLKARRKYVRSSGE